MFSGRLLRQIRPTRSRWFSNPATMLPSASFKASDLVITTTTTPKHKLPKEQLVFGQSTSDHLFEVEWTLAKGWSKPAIVPYHNFSLEPTASVFHYSLSCFEGMKAFKDARGNVRLFRPMENMKRLNLSAERLYFPQFDEKELLECIKQLVLKDAEWIPEGNGFSLYIRPTMVGTYPVISVGSSSDVLLFTLLSPVGPYFPDGFKPIKVYADRDHTRSWPGSAAAFKISANYAPTILPAKLCGQQGYNSIMWLQGDNITEAGQMNLLGFWVNESGEKELITCPLNGTILPGITRLSVLELARQWGEFKVTERVWTIQELIKAVRENRMLEMFGAGTAAIVCPIEGFGYGDEYFPIPCGKGDAGPLTLRLKDTISGIQNGEIPHEWSVLIS